MTDLTVAFADDHPLVLEGIASIFRQKQGFAVVGVASNVDEALAVVERARPDVLTLDLGLPGDTFSAILQVCERWPDTRVVVFTASETVEHAVKVLNAGARGYVLKGSTSDELSAALEAVSRGDIYINPSFAAKVITALQAGQSRASEQRGATSQLSHREVQITKMLQEGKRNREIAAALKLSEKTVKCYMTTLMQKLNARSRLEVVIALEQQSDKSTAVGSNRRAIN
jgi:two-component system, NarL family, nitrate/nitrite response regulator NarL